MVGPLWNFASAGWLRWIVQSNAVIIWLSVILLTTIGSAKKLALFAEDKFGVGALSFFESKSKKRKKKGKDSIPAVCPINATALTSIGSAKKLALFAEDKFGVGALSFSKSKSMKKEEENTTL